MTRGRKPLADPTPRQLRARARMAVYHAVRSGRLAPLDGQSCVDCGAPATCYDHRDYRLPLDVQPVCKGCNNRRGPGLPDPDAGRDPGVLREFGKKHSGIRWSAVEGGGGNAGPSAAGPDLVDDGDDWRPRYSYGVNELLAAALGKRCALTLGNWRADFFKSRDPWFADPSVLPFNPREIP